MKAPSRWNAVGASAVTDDEPEEQPKGSLPETGTLHVANRGGTDLTPEKPWSIYASTKPSMDALAPQPEARARGVKEALEGLGALRDETFGEPVVDPTAIFETKGKFGHRVTEEDRAKALEAQERYRRTKEEGGGSWWRSPFNAKSYDRFSAGTKGDYRGLVAGFVPAATAAAAGALDFTKPTKEKMRATGRFARGMSEDMAESVGIAAEHGPTALVEEGAFRTADVAGLPIVGSMAAKGLAKGARGLARRGAKGADLITDVRTPKKAEVKVKDPVTGEDLHADVSEVADTLGGRSSMADETLGKYKRDKGRMAREAKAYRDRNPDFAADPAYQEIEARRKTLRREGKQIRARAKALRKAYEDTKASIDFDTKKVPNPALNARSRGMVRASQHLDGAADLMEKVAVYSDPIFAPLFVGNYLKNKVLKNSVDQAWGARIGNEAGTPSDHALLALNALRDKNRPELDRFWDRDAIREGEIEQFRHRAVEYLKTVPKKDKPTLWQALHFEELSGQAVLRRYATRNVDAPAGQRFVANADAPDEVQQMVKTINEYDGIIDLSRQVSRESLETGLLKHSDDVWAPNVYLEPKWRDALKRRLVEKAGGRVDTAEWNMEDLLAERRAAGAASEYKVGGVGEKSRKLRELPVEERVSKYGMEDDFDTNVLVGLLRQKEDVATARMWQDLARDPSVVSRVNKRGWAKVSNATIEGTQGTRRYPGLPDEFWVSPDVGAELAALERVGQMYRSMPVLRFLRRATKWWKTTKTVGSPGTHATNVLGNFLVLAPMAGISPANPANWGLYGKSAKEFALGKNSAAYREWLENGGAGRRGTINRAEIEQRAEREFALYQQGVLGRAKDAGEAFVDSVTGLMTGDFSRAGKSGVRFGKTLVDAPFAAYNAEDNFFRFTLFLKKRAEGMDARSAALAGRKAFADYENMSGLMQAISVGAFGIPFLAFNARMVPRVYEWLKTHPFQARAYQKLYEVMGDSNLAASSMTPEDEERMKKGMPWYDRERMEPLARIAPSLARTKYGEMVGIDPTKYAPGYEYLKREGESAPQQASRVTMSTNPMFSSAVGVWTNRHPHFGKEITKDTDSPEMWKDKMLDFLASTWGPMWIPKPLPWAEKTWGGKRIAMAEKGMPRPYRTFPETPERALAAVGLGLRTATYSDDDLKKRQGMETKTKVANLERAIRENARNFAMRANPSLDTPEKLLRELLHLRDQMQGIAPGVNVDSQIRDVFRQAIETREALDRQKREELNRATMGAP